MKVVTLRASNFTLRVDAIVLVSIDDEDPFYVRVLLANGVTHGIKFSTQEQSIAFLKTATEAIDKLSL